MAPWQLQPSMTYACNRWWYERYEFQRQTNLYTSVHVLTTKTSQMDIISSPSMQERVSYRARPRVCCAGFPRRRASCRDGLRHVCREFRLDAVRPRCSRRSDGRLGKAVLSCPLVQSTPVAIPARLPRFGIKHTRLDCALLVICMLHLAAAAVRGRCSGVAVVAKVQARHRSGRPVGSRRAPSRRQVAHLRRGRGGPGVARGRRSAVPLVARRKALQGRQPQFPHHVIRDLHSQQLKLARADCVSNLAGQATLLAADALMAAMSLSAGAAAASKRHG